MRLTNWPHRRLNVWKLAMTLARSLYELTQGFPTSEQFGLSSQLRRAAVSVPSNIAEGLARHTGKDKMRFLYTAQGSLSEIDTQIELVSMIGYINSEEKDHFLDRIHEVQMMLVGLIRSIET